MKSQSIFRYLKTIAASLLCLLALTALSSCDKKQEPSNSPASSATVAPSASDRAAQEITNRIRDPQNRARQAQELILQADQRTRDAADQASR